MNEKESYYIQIGENDEDIIQGIDLTKEELNGVVKTLDALYKCNNVPVSIEDSYGNEYLCLGF